MRGDVLKVKDFTTVNYVHLDPQSTIREAVQAFLTHRMDIGCITKNKKLLGIVHKNSIYRALLQNASLDQGIKSLIKENVITISKEQSLYEAREIMIKGNVSHAVVLDEKNEVYGIMSKSDLLQSHMTVLMDTVNHMTSLIENLQDAVVFVDSNLKIQTFNQTALHLLQLKGKQLTNAPIDLILPPFRRWLIETLRTGTIQEAKKIRYNDFTVIASFIPIKQLNQISGAMVVLRDVTSYEKIANELETTSRLKKILDSALELAYDGVVITDSQGYITSVNDSFLELYQLKNKNEVIGKHISKIVKEIPFEKSLKDNKKGEGELIQIKGQTCMVAQFPISQNGQKLGAIFKIIFRQLESWRKILSQMEQLENEISYYREELYHRNKSSDPFPNVISINPIMKKFKEEAAIAAQSMSNVLITGESGTGKELFAQGIHHLSERKGAFIKVNCGAIPEELLESEFFGYADGAFTGAKRGGKPGKFELAHKGTIFLDEIGDMPLPLQVKLLRVLQEQEFERIGATKSTKVDVRIITATNKNLEKLVKEGKFREDLYYRINVIHLQIPPLRERIDDIPLLCNHFIQKISRRTNKKILGVSPEVIKVFQQYLWPGNIRQLENILERAFHYSQSNWIELEHLPKDFITYINQRENHIRHPHEGTMIQFDRKKSIYETEKQLILEALKKCNGNRTKAAKMLGISRTSLYQKMKKYNIFESIETHFTSL